MHSARPTFTWRLRTRSLVLGARTLIMGIVNVTPDSFSDGGAFFAASAAVDHALRLLDEGADLLDLGGESTRPGASPITADEEQVRILPVLRAVLKARPEAALSIDTYHHETARAAIDAGAEIINDVSGLLWDEQMAGVLSERQPGAVLMHTRGRPQEWAGQPSLAPAEVMPVVLAGLRRTIEIAEAAGVDRTSIVLDPGFGFGKRGAENFFLLADFSQLGALGMPLLAGISRKRFLTAALGKVTESEREAATTAANVTAILAGAHIVRVHEVAAARAAATVADASHVPR